MLISPDRSVFKFRPGVVQGLVLALGQRPHILLQSALQHNLLRPLQKYGALTDITAIAALTDPTGLAHVYLAVDHTSAILVALVRMMSMGVLFGIGVSYGWGFVGVVDVALELRVVLLAQLLDLDGQLGFLGGHGLAVCYFL